MIRDRIRRWLGIETINDNLYSLVNWQKDSQREQVNINNKLDVILPGLGRVIAKIDPSYGGPEMTKERRAESDKIGNEVIAKLMAEAKARAPYND